MKKITSLCLAIIICFSFVISAGAEGENVYLYNGVEVVFEEDSILSENMKLYVAEMLVCGNMGEDNVGTYNLLCHVVGHNYSTESVTTIQHKVNTVEPRCLMQTWELQICTVCEDTIPTLLTQRYIFCCPVE